jgi:hypothetical protein
LYDLNGNLIGRLDEQNMIDVRTWSMPVAFRKLLGVPQDGRHPDLMSPPTAPSLIRRGVPTPIGARFFPRLWNSALRQRLTPDEE